MTREDAIRWTAYVQQSEPWQERVIEALDMAIEALKRERTDEWCPGCKEYDTEKKCCPRFNRVIRGAMKREPSEDGTLEVKVEDATKVGRVLISDDKHRGGLYYPDEDEPQGVSFENDTEIKSYSKDSDLISREAAKDIAFRSPFFSDALMEELDALPSADRPRTIEPTITVDLESGIIPRRAIEKGGAIDMCMEVRDYLTSGNPIWDKKEVGKALDMAIEALKDQDRPIICPRCGRTFSEAEGREKDKMLMEDWLRGCVHHDGRKGNVYLPIDKVLQIADYIQRTRVSGTDGLIEMP